MSHSEVQNHRKGFEAHISKTAQRTEGAQAKFKKSRQKELAF